MTSTHEIKFWFWQNCSWRVASRMCVWRSLHAVQDRVCDICDTTVVLDDRRVWLEDRHVRHHSEVGGPPCVTPHWGWGTPVCNTTVGLKDPRVWLEDPRVWLEDRHVWHHSGAGGPACVTPQWSWRTAMCDTTVGIKDPSVCQHTGAGGPPCMRPQWGWRTPVYDTTVEHEDPVYDTTVGLEDPVYDTTLELEDRHVWYHNRAVTPHYGWRTPYVNYCH